MNEQKSSKLGFYRGRVRCIWGQVMRRTTQFRIYITYTNSSFTSTNSSPYISAPPSTSEKRSLLYNSLNGITNTNSQTKKLKTVENKNKEANQETVSSDASNLDNSSTETNNQTNPPQTDRLVNRAKDNYILLKKIWNCIRKIRFFPNIKLNW